MQKGDFSQLADDYGKYRASYNKDVVNVILNSVGKKIKHIKAADIGAGTGIFTKALTDAGVTEVVAIEPSGEMRTVGVNFVDKHVNFVHGYAEETGLQTNTLDLITMASSFHWPKTSDAIKEFNRILRPGGVFSALWNPRLTERSVIESEVQELLTKKYNIFNRVSSGLSGITSNLRETLEACGVFRSVFYVDAIDVVLRSQEQYLGAWRSVNDIQSQLGPKEFSKFIDDVGSIISKEPYVEVYYLTRAWIAIK